MSERVIRSPRGYAYCRPIVTEWGEQVQVHESGALVPHVWLSVRDAAPRTGTPSASAAHLSIKDARRLRRQLKALIRVREDKEGS